MKIFFIAPFQGKYEDVFEIVKSVSNESGYTISRADDFINLKNNSVKQQAENEISLCDIVIADVSKYDEEKGNRRTNNVRSEFEYAKILGKPIIPNQ